ncbi:transmembrane protein [Fagus crenata]
MMKRTTQIMEESNCTSQRGQSSAAFWAQGILGSRGGRGVPGRHGCVEFGNFQTSAAAILIHSLLYFALICVFLLAVKVHLYLG